MTFFFQLLVSALFPVAVAGLLYIADRKKAFEKMSYMEKQLLIGIIFGFLACLSTEFCVDINGAMVNVRDANPLCAGLIFGAPAGIIAGFIGGVERWLAALWGVGEYTRLACAVATIFAGFFAAAIRKYMFDDKKPSWTYGLLIGMVTEVLHMLMVFLTHMQDLESAFFLVQESAPVMILLNGVSVMLAILFVAWIGKEKLHAPKEGKKIVQTFQRWLLICVLTAFSVAGFSIFFFQNELSVGETDRLLALNVKDVCADIDDASDENLLSLTRTVARGIMVNHITDSAGLIQIAENYGIAEINLVNGKGIITASTDRDFLGYDMRNGKQSAAFLPLLSGREEMVQGYQPIAYDASIYRKYAGVALPDGGFVQVGYDAEHFQREIDRQIVDITENRHIGENGCIIICNQDWTIVSDNRNYGGRNLNITGLRIDIEAVPENMTFAADVYGKSSYCMYTVTEGYYIIAVQPKSEALFLRNVSVYMTVFMQILIFAALFAFVYFLIKRVIVDNIEKVNASLEKITGGNLNETVNVRSNTEFASLSDDINSTVDTLKRYIAEAEARIDQELEFARAIQHSALPSVFPPYPNRKDFRIFALMDTAKEVGGDFYDFYLLGDQSLGFLVADVSGKGIPAAMFMMTAKTLIKDFAESGMEVNDVFTRANEKLCEGNDTGMFVTAWMGILDLRTGLLRYANAGHNPPVVRASGGQFAYLKTRPNFVLAGMEGVKYRKHELWLQPGDEIYLYTDGVTEAQNFRNELYGEERLLARLNEDFALDVEKRCLQVRSDVEAFVGDMNQFDDITMLSLKLNALEKNDSIKVCPDWESVSLIADFIERKIAQMKLPVKMGQKIQIAVDEIYSNIVHYSGASSVEVHCEAFSGRLTVSFRDNGTPYNPLEADAPDVALSAEEREPGGLGIFMVRNMMDSVEYKNEDGWNLLKLSLLL